MQGNKIALKNGFELKKHILSSSSKNISVSRSDFQFLRVTAKGE